MKLLSVLLLSFSAYAASLMNGTVSSHGIVVKYETRLEPESPSINRTGGGTLTEDNVIKRHLCNFENNTYFGYDLTVEPLPDGRYRLRFAPLTITPEKMSEIFEKVSHWTLLPLPGKPATLEVRAGETIAMDLFVNPSTGQKVTDYLTLIGNGRQQVQIAGPARDFSPEDATIEIISPHLSIDGKPTLSSPAGISGHAVWIDIPAHGRFVFSLAARPDLGMQKAGEVRGTTMTWHTGGHSYTLTTAKPIGSDSRAFNLYVSPITRTVERFSLHAGPRPDDPIRSQ